MAGDRTFRGKIDGELIMQSKSDQFNLAFLWTVCLVAAMGGLLFGYDWVVIGGAKPFYEPFFSIANGSWVQGLTMSSALIGCLFGAVIGVRMNPGATSVTLMAVLRRSTRKDSRKTDRAALLLL